ncbi:hypothetical protein ACOSQ2_030176 [Xanthoceras sorbifolium]
MSNGDNDRAPTVIQPNRVYIDALEVGQRELRADLTRMMGILERIAASVDRLPIEGDVVLGVGMEGEVNQHTGRTHGVRTTPVNPLYDVDDGFNRQVGAPNQYRHGGRIKRGDRVAKRWFEPNRGRQRPGTSRESEDFGSSSEDEVGSDYRRYYLGELNFERPRN